MNFTNDLHKARAAQILSCYGITPEAPIVKSEASEEAVENTEVVADEQEIVKSDEAEVVADDTVEKTEE